MSFLSAYRGRPGSFSSSAQHVRRPAVGSPVTDVTTKLPINTALSASSPPTTTEFFDWVLSKLPRSQESHDGRVLLDDGHSVEVGGTTGVDDVVDDNAVEEDSWTARRDNLTDTLDAFYPVRFLFK